MFKYLILLLSIISFWGCGSSGSSTNEIDIANYLPSESMSKEYTHVIKRDGNLNNSSYRDTVVVESNLITIKKDTNLSKLISIKADEVEVKYIDDTNSSKLIKRVLLEGDTISDSIKKYKKEILKVGSQEIGERYTKKQEVCTFDSIVEEYKKFFFVYTNYDDEHDIMKIKCTTKTIVDTEIKDEYKDLVSYENGTIESKPDIYYIYLQKDLGVIAKINDDCLASKMPDVIDDTLEPKMCLGERYEYDLYQPHY